MKAKQLNRVFMQAARAEINSGARSEKIWSVECLNNANVGKTGWRFRNYLFVNLLIISEFLNECYWMNSLPVIV